MNLAVLKTQPRSRVGRQKVRALWHSCIVLFAGLAAAASVAPQLQGGAEPVVIAQAEQKIRDTVKKLQPPTPPAEEPKKGAPAGPPPKQPPPGKAAKKGPEPKKAPAKAPEAEALPEETPDEPPDKTAEEQERAEFEALPKLEEMQLPSAEDLLHKPPVDWIVLKKQERVLVTKPVYPRPDTLTKMQDAYNKVIQGRRPKDDAEKAAFQKLRIELTTISIELVDGTEQPEFGLPMQEVKEIVYHEQLVMRRIDALAQEGQMRTAYELLFRLERDVPDWPGVFDVHNRVLYFEAETSLRKGDAEAALVYLQDLHARKADFEGLSQKLGAVCDALIAASVDKHEYARGRHYLSRLAALFPNHSVVRKWREQLLELATAERDRALAVSAQGKHREAALLIDRSARIWPQTPELRVQHGRLTGRYQLLTVGVLRLPGASGPRRVATQADQRFTKLTTDSLFEVTGMADGPRYETRFFERWEPTDLGRRALLSLRPTRAIWESQPVVTAAEVVEYLSARCRAEGDHYDERFSSFVRSFEVVSPFEFQIEFSRVPLSLESLLCTPIAVPAAGADGSQGSASPLDAQPFRVVETTPDQFTYERNVPQRDDAPAFHVAEVVEKRFDSHEKAVQSLLRGEATMLADVPARLIDRFKNDERFFIRQYALPVTHGIQINPRSKTLRNRELRRALAHSIDNHRLLDDVVLHEKTTVPIKRAAPAEQRAYGRVVTACFPYDYPAYDRLIPERDFNLTFAYTLAYTARKQAKDQLPPLVMLCVDDPVALEVADEIVKEWARIGIQVKVLADDGTKSADLNSGWDLIYRTARMADPVHELWPFLTLGTTARVADLEFLPQLLRGDLIKLDEAPDWNAAHAALRRLHGKLYSEVQYIPLFEVDEFMVARKGTLVGTRNRPLFPYQDIQQWTVQLPYPEDRP